MESHQELDIFLPKLRARLISKGMTAGDATFACTVIATGALPRTINSLVEYQSAWTICNSMTVLRCCPELSLSGLIR